MVLAKPVDRDNYVRYTRAHERKPAAVLQPSVQMANGLQGIVSRIKNLKILSPSFQKSLPHIFLAKKYFLNLDSYLWWPVCCSAKCSNLRRSSALLSSTNRSSICSTRNSSSRRKLTLGAQIDKNLSSPSLWTISAKLPHLWFIVELTGYYISLNK